MRTLAGWCVRHRRIVLLLWAAVLVGSIALVSAFHADYSNNFNFPHTESSDAINLLKSAAPGHSGDTEQVVFGISHVFFVVVINTMAAVRSVSHGYVVAARSFGAGRLRIYRSIYLPAMAPLVVSGLRYGMIFNVIGILLAEMYASNSGLGLLLSRWGETYDANKLMAATVLIAVVTIAMNEAMRLWEARVARWNRS